jgi:hypothetical protein
VLGPLLALRRRGRYGLAFLDGHADFQHPSACPTSSPIPSRGPLVTGGRTGSGIHNRHRALLGGRFRGSYRRKPGDGVLAEARAVGGCDPPDRRWPRTSRPPGAPAR